MKKFIEDLIRSGIAFWTMTFSMMACMGVFTMWIGLCVKFGAISTEYFDFCRKVSFYNQFTFDPQTWAIPWIIIGAFMIVVNAVMLFWTVSIEQNRLPEE